MQGWASSWVGLLGPVHAQALQRKSSAHILSLPSPPSPATSVHLLWGRVPRESRGNGGQGWKSQRPVCPFSVTHREAERLLETQPQGCYLVRFSESAVTFVLTYR